MTVEAEQRLVAEQVALLHRQGPSGYAGSFVSAVVLVWVLWDEPLERTNLLIWMFSVCAAIGLRWFEFEAYRADPQRLQRGARWGWWFTAGAATSGVVWGYLGWAFFQPTLLFLLPITLGLAGQVGLSVTSIGIFLPAHLAFNVLALTPFVLRNYLEEGRLFLGQSVLLLVFMLACLFFARRQQAMIRDAIQLRLDNQDLFEQVTRENERAIEARHQAEVANEAKTRFLAAASHDLRQPLQAMTLFVHAIEEGLRRREELDPALVGKLRSSSDSLEMLLDSLLDLSRADVGALKPEICDFALQPILDRLRREFTDQAADKGLQLRVVPSRAYVRSDPTLLERMLRNLTANALRYTEQGGVLVACRSRGGSMHLEVRDSGIGIPEHARGEIFREFYQLDNPERDRRKGLGLGLAIVDALARQLGHRLGLRSAPGRGSVFTIEVPPGQPGTVAATDLPPASGRLEGMWIVVMDDEAPIREALANVLERWGCRVAGGENADEVLAVLGAAGMPMPAAILADWRLREGRKGDVEACELRRCLGRPVPVLLITGDTDPDTTRDVGFPVIHKPIKGFSLRARLDALLANQE